MGDFNIPVDMQHLAASKLLSLTTSFGLLQWSSAATHKKRTLYTSSSPAFAPYPISPTCPSYLIITYSPSLPYSPQPLPLAWYYCAHTGISSVLIAAYSPTTRYPTIAPRHRRGNCLPQCLSYNSPRLSRSPHQHKVPTWQ
ncbi:hypothetical protein PRIEUP_LOCUS5706 [Pristimantis euphronides]